MPRLKVTYPNSERTEYEFGEVSVSIGREADNMIVLDSAGVSAIMRELFQREDGWWLRDLGSVNGIVSGGKRVADLKLADR
jgi:pSer/pThr/pTyr-binding forkhead associated (FHA) protein